MPTDYPLLVLRAPIADRRKRPPGGPIHFDLPGPRSQARRLEPQFQRLQSQLEAERARIVQDGAAVNPEQVLVLETIGDIPEFARAARAIGLGWLIDWDEDPIPPERGFAVAEHPDQSLPHKLFLVSTDQRALEQILSLWKGFKRGAKLAHGLGRWKALFNQLREVRYWDVADRIEDDVRAYWQDQLALGVAEVRTEIELWHRESAPENQLALEQIEGLIDDLGGRILDRARIDEIRYHAVLVDLPRMAVVQILEGRHPELALSARVMFFRPRPRAMTAAAAEELSEGVAVRPIPEDPPVVAVLDGVPLANHTLLGDRLRIDDPEDLTRATPAQDRCHGTAIASLILHGDLSGASPTIRSKVHVRPVLVPNLSSPGWPRSEHVESDKLFANVVLRAVRRIKQGEGGEPPAAPTVRVINLSICDETRPFGRRPSPVARLIDWLAWRHDVLFVVPSGNLADPIDLPVARAQFTALDVNDRAAAALRSISARASHQRLLSPAESINALTVGASYEDSSTYTPIDGRFPIALRGWPSPLSRLGLGVLGAVKPDLLMPGGRMLYSEVLGTVHANARVQMVNVSTPPGIRAAAPARVAGGALGETRYVHGTSYSAALTSHCAALCHGALQEIRADLGDSAIPVSHDAVLLKALVTHSCAWAPLQTALEALGIADSAEKADRDRASRLWGYGPADPARAVECAASRATMIACGDIAENEALIYEIPLPAALSGQRDWRRLTLTLAWLSPIDPGSREYRTARLWMTPPHHELRVKREASADWRTVQKGTIQHEVLEGNQASVFQSDTALHLRINCIGDAAHLPGRARFAVCASLEVLPESRIPVYDQIRELIRPRIAIAPQ